MITNKVIHGYQIELELDPDVEWSDCWITKDGFRASLACLEYEGSLYDNAGNTVEVNPRTIDVIAKWAESNGY